MKSISALREKVQQLTAESKDHRRSGQIQQLKGKVREAELVSDVLKAELRDRVGMTADEVSEFVVRKTVGGPKRFRPKTREELELQVSTLEKRVASLQSKLSRSGGASGARGSARRGSSSSRGARSAGKVAEEDSPASARSTGETGSAVAVVAGAHASALNDKVESLTIELAAKKRAMEDLTTEVEALSSENRRLRAFEDKARRLASKHAQAKEALASLQQENLDVAREREAAAEDLRAAQAEAQWLNEELERVRKEAARAQRDAAAEIADLQARQLELTSDLENAQRDAALASENRARDRRSGAGDSAAVKRLEDAKRRLDNRVKDLTGELETVRKQLADARAEAREARADADDAEAELEKLERRAGAASRGDTTATTDGETDEDAGGLRARIAELKAELAAERRRADATTAAAGSAAERMEDVASEAGAAMEQLAEENKELKAQIRAMEKQITAAKYLHRQEAKRAARMQEKLDAGRGKGSQGGAMDPEERSMLEDRIKTQQYEIDSLKSTISTLEAERVSIRRQLKLRNQRMRTMQHDLDSANDELIRVQAEFRKDLAKLKSSTEKSGSHKKVIEQLQRSAEETENRLREQLAGAESDLEVHVRVAEVCRTAVEQFQGHTEVLEARLESFGVEPPACPVDVGKLASELDADGESVDDDSASAGMRGGAGGGSDDDR